MLGAHLLQLASSGSAYVSLSNVFADKGERYLTKMTG
jgi:hypothetical protein